MAAISGTGARIYFSTSTGAGSGAIIDDMIQWSLNVDAGTIDTNAFGSTWRGAIAGLRGWSGSASGFWNATTGGSTEQRGVQTQILTGDKSHVQLVVDNANGNGYEGDCWVSGLQVAAQVDGAVGFSFDFAGEGALSYSSAL